MARTRREGAQRSSLVEFGRMKARWQLVVLIAVTSIALASCTPEPKLEPGSVTRAVLDGQDVRIDAPLTEEIRGVAVWFHGRGGDVDTRMDSNWLNSIREAGWAVASGDLGGPTGWGDPASVSAAGELSRWASDQAGAPVKLVIAGSMGAVVALNAMVRGGVEAPCFYAIMPVFDLRSLPVPSYIADLQRVYPTGIPASANPAESDLPRVTYRVLSSDSDSEVPAQLNADVFASRTDASVLKVQGDHGDRSHFNADDLSQFAMKCLHDNG